MQYIGAVSEPVYLDNQSTTAVSPEVVAAMLPYLTERYGHPASKGHPFGWDAERGVENARAEVADAVGAAPREIVFTSGGTEADNLAIKGVAEVLAAKGRHIVTTAIENRPVLDTCGWLERQGFEVTYVGCDGEGIVAPSAVAEALRDDTILVSVHAANHEVGTLQDVRAIGAACRARGIWFHTDASHALAWCAFDLKEDPIDLMSLAGHRCHGPKGIGALYVRRSKPRVRLAPQLHGGGHEQGLRSGTINVPGAVGFGAAVTLVLATREDDARRVGALRDELEQGLLDGIADARVLGAPAARLPNNLNLVLDGVEGEAVLVGLPDIALATGSACTSATLETSHVLRAMGVDKAAASASVRFSLSRTTTDEEIARAIPRVIEVVERLRALGR